MPAEPGLSAKRDERETVILLSPIMINEVLSALNSISVDFFMVCIVYISLLIYIILERKGKKPAWQLPAMLLLYAVVYGYVVFYRVRYNRPFAILVPFWSYYRVIRMGLCSPAWWLAREIIQNILLYIPLGMVLACAFRKRRLLYPLLTSILLSFLTEIIQYYTRTGIAEFDDIFNNTLGCLAGSLIILATWKRIYRKEKIPGNIPEEETI